MIQNYTLRTQSSESHQDIWKETPQEGRKSSERFKRIGSMEYGV